MVNVCLSTRIFDVSSSTIQTENIAFPAILYVYVKDVIIFPQFDTQLSRTCQQYIV